ncbi:Lactonase, 7-bladed beta-propeller-domain-containing protein [Radiomyces spectabilis]|uniref:Lactonase, 7-bladed beta-propeller-domain-containing protein n=1 Tax=Radiomyces spectabilis TaxID=64574 RepID=UPI002220E009|nr:Lactonase, 7-bladed beta-propeller-domain-containing protein [Radiomyces spectabilis]KAI8374668.1 Lactonase, 7-bladed beta-propeller-domain-containing protein [Radiomyces spectabilis]
MSPLTVYVSGHTNDTSRGIYQYEFDTETGVLTPKGLAAESKNPTFFAFHKSGQHLYAVNEVAEYKDLPTGYLSAYNVDKDTGKLTLANEQPTDGEEPCHLALDTIGGEYVLVANYSGGSVASFPIISPGSPQSRLGEAVCVHRHANHHKASGGIPDRQEKPHAHSVDIDPTAHKWMISMDLGCDLAIVYQFDRRNGGKLAPHSTFQFPKGTGPRHLKFAPHNDGYCYVISEFSNVIFMLEFNFLEGKFYEVQRINGLPDDFKGENLGSEIDISPDGKHLYASMRGHDSIAMYTIDEYTGKLSLIGHQSSGGKHPRHFTIDPKGRFLLVGNKDSNNITVFKIDQETGRLTEVHKAEHEQPTCIKFRP